MAHKQWDALWVNGSIATMAKGSIPYGLLKQAALAVKEGRIVWLGLMSALPAEFSQLAESVHDLQGRCVTPGLIECHTHLVFAGNRAHEFAMRLQGASYESITHAGGGIRSTVAATRAASEEALLKQSLRRAKAFLTEGVLTLEIKSGYGLDLITELKMLRVAKQIGELLPIRVRKTFLGAHALPAEYQNRSDEYINLVCTEMLSAVAQAGLADAVDVFCEKIAFNVTQAERVFKAATALGLPVKCHAEQLSELGATVLAARYSALSVDHLEFLSEQGVAALAKADTVAVLLPGAFYYLREQHKPPIQLLRDYGVSMAISTDCNPGTSPVTSLLLMLNMACTLFKLTPEEALAGVTRNAAKALGLADSLGTLEVGKIADFVVWDIEHPLDLIYQIGLNPLVELVKEGNVICPQ